MNMKRLTGFNWCRLGMVGLLLAFSQMATASPPVIGKCVACHGADGLAHNNEVFPVIAGTPPVHIEEAIYAYKDGARKCRVVPFMCELAKGLSDEEVAEAAEYYSTQKRGSSYEEFDEDLAREGEQIHERLCSRCHVPPDDPEVADAFGYPLHGQRRLYLQYALESYLDGTRENLLPAMAEKLELLAEGDVEALVNYYASYKPAGSSSPVEAAPSREKH